MVIVVNVAELFTLQAYVAALKTLLPACSGNETREEIVLTHS